MTKLSKAAFFTKYTDASTGLFRAGQTAGIGSDDHRTFVDDIEDSFINKEDEWMKNGSVDTTGATITLAMENRFMRSFYGSNVIDGARTIALTNFLNLIAIPSFRFELDGAHVLTFPSNTRMSDALWDASAKTWTPLDAGAYEMKITYDEQAASGLLYVQIFGPFT